YENNNQLRCTYITIPQAVETAAILLSQPWWMWGAEMGANEYGVVIGNEAVYTCERLNETGLLGMDLLRLGLERGKSAKDAMRVICALLEEYGQGGGCSHDDPGWTYHNSFLIADPVEAYVLETAGAWWIAERVRTVRSISNNVSIRGKGDFRREGIIQYAIESGYCKDDDDFDFALTFTGQSFFNGESPFSRGGKSKQMLEQNKKIITPGLMMEFLREHDMGICMHGAFESTGSQVSELKQGDESVHWFTGSTLPCLSNFKPYTCPYDGKYSLDPGPYKAIDSGWFWNEHNSKIQSFKESTNAARRIYEHTIAIIEKKSVESVEAALSTKNFENQGDFREIVKTINSSTWEATEKLIKSK
ncbi:MAG: C69 family dipeptidase, partial [Promethearchaeota archaeon]